MPIEGHYEPNKWKFAADQVERYEAKGGVEGADLNGKPTVILTSRGRKSGFVRKTPLMRVEHDGVYAVVASMGGAPKHPVWYLNLMSSPEITLQDGPVVHAVRAREVSGDEKAAWWARAVQAWPAYADYQLKTERQIPVVLLEEVKPR